jgi:hypothetical protein
MSVRVNRFVGRAYPVRDIVETQSVHGRLGAHIQAEWTTPEHWAHNNYERSHLPQLCIRASGWKARLLALLVWPQKPWTPNDQAQL